MKTKQTMFITIGLQGSGKSTWADIIIKNSSSIRKVERDEIRTMLFGKRYTGNKEDEQLVTEIQESIISILGNQGYSIIVSDTNLNPKTVIRLRELAESLEMEFEINDSFLQVSVDECIKRDQKRGSIVGEKVIRDTYNKYLNPKKENSHGREIFLAEQDQSLPKCIIVDIDNTVALNNGRNPYNWKKVDTDLPNLPVIDIINKLADCYILVFFSGRDSVCYNKTKNWLSQYIGSDFLLYMRQEKDFRKDSIVKKEMFSNFIKDRYCVQMVFDDRDSVVSMWRNELGLPVCQVNYGNF